MNFLLHVIAIVLLLLLVAIPWLNGVADLYMAWRFRREVKEEADQTAFFLNWFAFKWSWVNYAHKIVEKLPFFQKDLTETFGIRDDDGRIT